MFGLDLGTGNLELELAFDRRSMATRRGAKDVSTALGMGLGQTIEHLAS